MTVTLSTLIYQPGKTRDVEVSQMYGVVMAGPRKPAYPDEKVLRIATRWAHWSDTFGFLRSLTWGQGPGHETGWFWSRVEVNQVQPSQNNWGGLGADNSGAAGGTFGDTDEVDAIDHGILAFMAHLCLYVFGTPDKWPEHLRKYAKYAYRLNAVIWAHNNIEKPDGTLLRHLATVKTPEDMKNGRWAQTDDPLKPIGTLLNGYANGTVAKANEVRQTPIDTGDTPEPPKEAPPMSLTDTIAQRIRDKGVEVHDIRSKVTRHKTDRYRRLPNTAWLYTGVHHSAVSRGVRALQGDIDSWVGHSNYHVNTHGWPGIAYALGVSLSGRVFVLRDIEEEGYHAFSANNSSIGICGDLTIGNTITAPFRKSLLAVLEVLHAAPEFPNLKDRAGTFGHRELAFVDQRNSGTSCPGDLLTMVREYRTGDDPQPPTETLPKASPDPWGTSFWIPDIFISDIRKHDWMLTGICQGGAFMENGKYVQYFERARLEIAPDGGVTRGLVGSELLELKGRAA